MGTEEFLDGIRRVQQGDRAAEEALLRENLPLVAAIARNRQLIIPSGDDCLLPEDRVVIVAPRDVTISALKDVFPGGSL